MQVTIYTRRALLILLAGLAASWPSLAAPVEAEEAGAPPRLILFLTVDQLKYDYLERLRDDLSGGLGRLMREGVVFDRAFHGHAVTSTGPGHASLASGVYPSHSGIIDNEWFDRERGERVNCVEDPTAEVLDGAGSGRSPRNLVVDTLADWIKAANPDSKVFGASRKDRSAILPAGHRADGAFWYDSDTGRFVTSDYYMAGYPDWVLRFHEDQGPERYFGKAWTALEISPDLASRSHFEGLDMGAFSEGLPRALGGLSLEPNRSFYSDFGASPLMDQYLVEFVKSLVDGEGVGRDDNLDYLSISFSALDSVGHDFGPNSPEVLDTLLRLDAALGDLLDFLDERVGKGRLIVTLSADHGVVPLPEYQASKQLHGARVATSDIVCFQRAGRALEERYGEERWLLDGLYLNYETIGRRNLLRSEVEATLARSLESCPPLRKAWTRTQLEAETPASDPFHRLYRNNFYSPRSPDLMLQWQEYWLSNRGRGTTHGSPYDYDRHVPLILFLPGVAPQRVAQPVETVDLVPTLCGWLGMRPLSSIDGRDLGPLLWPAEPVASTSQPD